MNEADGGLVFRVSGGDGTVGFFALSLSLLFLLLSYPLYLTLSHAQFSPLLSLSIACTRHTPMLRIYLPGRPEM